jgi:glycyl-tRNA synthetase
MVSLQDAIVRLTEFWTDHGCVLAQPMNTEVGAGTYNPATFLRVLGPEPWHTAYVEPSVRPDDSRYGDNPNRLQTHHQFQVILKPDPGNPQEIYIESLKALGIDTDKHDLRFVEDNWESPALGAWGLGWEVWLDGLEITQYTYFQQAGGFQLNPPSVELTYGLERILMALQNVRDFKDIEVAKGVKYGDIFGQAEYELSTYYLDQADIESNRKLFDIYEAEAHRMIDQHLPIPAHVFLLKCSHIFNVLDSRGAVGVTERAHAFGRMREMAHDVAQLWLQKREDLEYPLSVVEEPQSPAPPKVNQKTDQPQDFLLEIGCEELPVSELDGVLRQLRSEFPEMLKKARLSFGTLQVLGTPRRLIVQVEGLAPHQTEKAERVRGPRVSQAFDEGGKITPAGLGFAKSRGLDPEALQREGEYVVADIVDKGQDTMAVLSESVPKLLSNLSFERNMRWTLNGVSWSRPVRWLLALFGDEVVPLVFAGLVSGRETRLLRSAKASSEELKSASYCLPALRKAGIEPDLSTRREMIVEQANKLAADVKGVIDVDGNQSLFDEIANLVEAPVALRGDFESHFLELPAEILATVMKKHQRYIPVVDTDGKLLPHFIAIANGAHDTEIVRAGNENVLRARYSDAQFFWKADLATSEDQLRERLEHLVFQGRLGSMLSHSRRASQLASTLARWIELSNQDVLTLDRAGALAKLDLATQMVVELSSLAGTMGRIYARQWGERPEVCEAIYEQVLPRFPGDILPKSKVGALLSVADRLDAIVGLIAAGVNATGSADPYGIRRMALGVVQVLCNSQLSIDIYQAVEAAAEIQPLDVSGEQRSEAVQLILRRMEQMLADEGHRKDFVSATVRVAHDISLARTVLSELEENQESLRFWRLVEAYKRPINLTRAAHDLGKFDPNLLQEDAEKKLWETFQTVVRSTESAQTLNSFIEAFDPLVDALHTFFDSVLVMVDDEKIRKNRLALLKEVQQLGESLMDWTALQEPSAVASTQNA